MQFGRNAVGVSYNFRTLNSKSTAGKITRNTLDLLGKKKGTEQENIYDTLESQK